MSEANPVHFIHVRTKKEDGTNSEKGGGTIAYCQSGESAYKFYVSHVNPKDNFNAKIGREVSRGRLLNPREREDIHYVSIIAGADHDTVHAAIMDGYTVVEEARKAAYLASIGKTVAQIDPELAAAVEENQ